MELHYAELIAETLAASEGHQYNATPELKTQMLCRAKWAQGTEQQQQLWRLCKQRLLQLFVSAKAF